MSCLTKNERKRPNKRYTSFIRVYDADIDQIVNLWFSDRYKENCPILSQCETCGRCQVFK